MYTINYNKLIMGIMETLIANNLGPIIANLGVAGVFFTIYWYERKDNKEMTRQLMDKYEKNTIAMQNFADTIERTTEVTKVALENNTKTVETLVTKVDGILTNGRKR